MNKKERKQEEEENNMEYFCEHHSDERLKEWQENNKSTKISIGDHVKVSFPAYMPGKDPNANEKYKLTKEWMWIQVSAIQDDGKRIIGILDNEPVYFTKPRVKYKQIIITFREEIADLIVGNWKPGQF